MLHIIGVFIRRHGFGGGGDRGVLRPPNSTTTQHLSSPLPLGRAKEIISFASGVFDKKERRVGGFFFIFNSFLLNSLLKLHEEEFDGDMLFVSNITSQQ